MKIAQKILVKMAQSVLIQKKVLIVFVHHGKKIVPDVNNNKNQFVFSTIYLRISLAYQVGCSCKNGGRCVMNYGSYGCECPYGYTGINCETCMKKIDVYVYIYIHYLVTGLVPEELLPLLLKEAAVENAEEG
jgi:hypothetical protein